MKLFRLITEDPNGIFNNSLNEDLVVPPDSKIALQSLSMETKNDVIIIDSSNDELSFQVSTGYQKVIQLAHNTYNNENYFDLLNDIKDKFNEATGFDITSFEVRRNLGLEWLCSVGANKKISIQYRIGQHGEHVPDWSYDNAKVQRTNQVWRRVASSGAGNNNDASVLFDHFISRGCSYMRGRINSFSAPTLGTQPQANGYMIGLSTTNISQLEPSDITDDMLSYGIHVAYDSSNNPSYYVVIDGVLTLTNVRTPVFFNDGNTSNDYQEVILNFGNIEFNIYNNISSTPFELLSVPHVEGTKLYPFMVFRGENASVNGVRTVPSPFSGVGDVSHTYEPGGLGLPPSNPKNPSENYLQLNEDIASFLGYNNPRQPQVGFIDTVQHNYVANKLFDPQDIADAFIIELLNLKCDSYDGLLNQRKNILAVVPKSNKGGELIYEVNNPIFIDLNNRSDILLRNLRIRVVKPDYSPISMLGQASMVVLLSS